MIEVRLSAIRYAARDTNLYEFRRPDGKPLPAYEPGAHVDMHLPNGLVRNYSMIVARPEPSTYTFGIKRDPASRGGSRYIHDELRVGKTLKISAPRNNFPRSRRTPGMSSCSPAASASRRSGAWCSGWRSSGGRGSSIIPAARAPTWRSSMRSKAWAGATLHFDDENAGKFLDIAGIVGAAPRTRIFYCCGPTPMMNAFEAATASWPRAQVHVEYFTPRQEPAKKGGFTVELARSGQEFFIPEGQTILQVLLDEGVDVDYSCELGICGACEQRVISGIPEHRDAILTEEEQAENKRVMICCAGCKSERLVLDL